MLPSDCHVLVADAHVHSFSVDLVLPVPDANLTIRKDYNAGGSGDLTRFQGSDG